MSLRVVIHARVSTEQQRSGYSLETQVRAGELLAAQLGAEIVERVVVDLSAGAEAQRDDLDTVRALIRTGQANGVIFFEIDRATRGGLVDYILLIDELKALGAAIYFSKRGAKAGETPDEQFMDNLLAVFAERERQVIRERTMRGTRGKALRGAYIGNGIAPFGYTRVGERHEVTLVIDEETASVVRQMFAWFTGQGGEPRMGVRAIAAALEAQQILPPADRLGRAKKRGYGSWANVTIYSILRNPVYTGVAYAFRTKVSGRSATKRSMKLERRPEADWLPAAVPIIVDEVVWARAQDLLDTGRDQSPRNARYTYLLGRRIRCACGCTVRGKVVNRPGGHAHFYYACHGNDPGAFAHPCDLSYLPVAVVDGAIWAWVAARLTDDEALTLDASGSADEEQQRDAVLSAQLQRIAVALASLDEEEQRILRLYRRGVFHEDALIAQQQEIAQQRQAQQEARERLSGDQQRRARARQFQQQTNDLVHVYRLQAHTTDALTRRTIIEALGVFIEVGQVAERTWRAIINSAFSFNEARDVLTIRP